MNLNLGGFNTA